MESASTLDNMALGARRTGQRIWRSSFVRDVLLLSGGTGIAQAISLAILPLLSRLYSPEDFGLLALYISIILVLAIFASFNYELMVVQSRTHRSASQLVWLILAIGISAAVAILIVVVLYRLQIAELLGTPEVAAWLWTVPTLLVITAFYRALRYWKIRLGQFGVVSRSIIIRSFVFAAVATVMAFIPLVTTLKGAGLIIAYIFSEFVKMLVLLLSVRNRDRKQFAPANRRRIEAVGRRNGPAAATVSASRGMAVVNERIPDFMIAPFFGAAALGFYAIVDRIVAVPTRLVSNAIGDVYRQRASKLHRKQGRFDELTLKILGMTAAISFVPFVVAITYAPTLFSILLGPEWKLAGHYASILLVGEFVAFVVNTISSATLIVEDKRFIFFWSLTRMLLSLCLFPLVYLGVLDFVGFLWGLVGIRILMVSLDGLACFMCAKRGRPVCELAYARRLWKAGREAE